MRTSRGRILLVLYALALILWLVVSASWGIGRLWWITLAIGTILLIYGRSMLGRRQRPTTDASRVREKSPP